MNKFYYYYLITVILVLIGQTQSFKIKGGG
jgi:hypothetical protein